MVEYEALIFMFETPLKKYIYDTNRNAIIAVSEYVYNFLKKNMKHLNHLEMVKDKCHTVNTMIKDGYLSNNKIQKIEHPATEYLEDILDNKLQTLTLQITQQCNLRCKYCVYSGSYINRRHSDKIMSFDIAKRGIDFLIEHSRNSQILNLGFYGGEPLLEYDLIKQCVNYIQEKAEGKKVTFNITTNATLLNEENIKFFMENNIDIMISLDGPKEIHNKNRVFAANGRGTFDVIVEKLEMIKKTFPNYYGKIHFNSVIDPKMDLNCFNEFFSNSELLKDSLINTNFVSTDYMLEEDEKEWSIIDYFDKYEYEKFKMFLSKLGRFDAKNVSKVAEAAFDSMKMALFTMRTNTQNLTNTMHPGGACIPGVRKLFMNIEGDLFPCEKCSETSSIMKIGNIKTGFDIEAVSKLLNVGKVIEDKCKNCWAVRLCEICPVSIDDNGVLSERRKLENCRDILSSRELQLKNYCMLKEFGYDFDDMEIVNFEGEII